MDSFTYAGITIGLGGLASTLDWRRDAEYDGPTFLGIRHHIRIRGWINPNGVSYTATNTDPPTPVLLPGQPPALTDTLIRDILSQPQQQLICISGGRIVLLSPLPVGTAPPPVPPPNQPPNALQTFPSPDGSTYPPIPPPAVLQANFPSIAVDADLGPVPEVHSVRLNLGNKTWEVEFSISTLVNVCGQNDPPPDVINSHRWTMSHDLDTEGLCSRTIHGHVFFRTDRLFAFNQTAQAALGQPVPTVVPDQFRGWLMHPPFPNSRREILRCEPNANGDELTYTIRDVELPINLYAKGVTRVECLHSVEADYGGGEAALRRLLNSDLRNPSVSTAFDASTVFNTFGGAGAAAVEKYFGGGIGILGGALLKPIMDIVGYNPNNVPVVLITVVVRAWGHRNTTRYNLQNVAWNLAMSRISLSIAGLTNVYTGIGAKLLSGRFAKVEHDVVGKFVTVQMQLRSQFLGKNIVDSLTPVITGLAPLTMPAVGEGFPYWEIPKPGFVGPPAPGDRGNPDPTSDETPTSTVGGAQNLNTLNIGPQQGTGYINDGQSRGSYLGLAVQQALLAPCQQSPYPQDPPKLDTTGQDTQNPYKSWSPP